MDVRISADPKLSKLDHLFVLFAEGEKPRVAIAEKAIRKAVEDSGFAGRDDQSITILNDEPKKLTLIGLGKREKLSIRSVRAAIYSVAKTAKKNRDRAIAVALPYVIADLTADETTRVV